MLTFPAKDFPTLPLQNCLTANGQTGFSKKSFKTATTETPPNTTKKERQITQQRKRLSLLRTKNCLLNSIDHFDRLFLPPRFSLLRRGSFFGTAIMRGGHSSAFCGLSADGQFAPLPQSIRQAKPELSKVFASRYADYRKKLATPLLKSLTRCNEMAILLGVTTLLAANTGMYNAPETCC